MTRRLSNKTKALEPHAVAIPTREDVIALLTEEGVPIAEVRLAELLGISPAQREGFERRLAAMERDGQVMRNRRGAILIADKAGLVKGRVIGHADGFGFLKHRLPR
jgi:ribonuclease R